MKKAIVFGLFIVLAAFVAAPAFAATPALDSEFLTIVGADAPTTDVITAANFAATIKQLGMTFTGATDADALAYYDDDELRYHYLVVIDGKSVKLLGTTEYSKQVEDYFYDQGFSVQVIEEAKVEDLEVTTKAPKRDTKDDEVEDEPEPVVVKTTPTPVVIKEQVDPEPVKQPSCKGCLNGEECLREGDITVVDEVTKYCDGATLYDRKSKGESCSHDYECASGEFCTESACGGQQSTLQRFFTWLAKLF